MRNVGSLYVVFSSIGYSFLLYLCHGHPMLCPLGHWVSGTQHGILCSLPSHMNKYASRKLKFFQLFQEEIMPTLYKVFQKDEDKRLLPIHSNPHRDFIWKENYRLICFMNIYANILNKILPNWVLQDAKIITYHDEVVYHENAGVFLTFEILSM